MLTVTATVALFAQATSPGTAIIADDAERWELSYPILISPYIDDYYGCLKSGTKYAGKGWTFEPQHRADIGRCVEVGDENQQEANAILKARGWDDLASPQDVADTFAAIRRIHVSRGRDLDTRIAKSLARSVTQYSPEMHPDYAEPEASTADNAGASQ